MNEFLGEWAALAGVAMLIAALINAGKAVGWVKDGTAQNWSVGLNLVGMVLLLAAKIFKPELDITQIDSVAGTIAQILMIVVGLVVQFAVSRGTHAVLRGVPVVGTSNTTK